MDLPKLALLCCCKCSIGCLSRIIMHLKWKVFDNEFNISRVFLQHLPEDGFKPRTVGSLVVIEDSNGD